MLYAVRANFEWCEAVGPDALLVSCGGVPEHLVAPSDDVADISDSVVV